MFRDEMSISQYTLCEERTLSVDFNTYFIDIYTKTYTAPSSTLLKSFSDKTTAKKKRWILSKIIFLDASTTFFHTFLYGNLHSLPRGDPKILWEWKGLSSNNLLIACPQGILALLLSGSSSHVIISGASLSSTSSSSSFWDPPRKRKTRYNVECFSIPYVDRWVCLLFSSVILISFPPNIKRCSSTAIPFRSFNNPYNLAIVAS